METRQEDNESLLNEMKKMYAGNDDNEPKNSLS